MGGQDRMDRLRDRMKEDIYRWKLIHKENDRQKKTCADSRRFVCC